MTNDPWLPRGYKISDEVTIHSLIFSGNEWQIFSTQESNNILISLKRLSDRWIEKGFLGESMFKELKFGANLFWYLLCHKNNSLFPVESGKSPSDKADALSFAAALRESRQISTEDSFHDSIFVEQYSRMLPTWTISPQLEDEVVLGKWITGGVSVSTNSFRRIRSLVGWMSPSDLAEIIQAAGLEVSSGTGLFADSNIQVADKHDPETEEKVKPSNDLEDGSPSGVSPRGVFRLPGRPGLEEFFNEHIIDIIVNAPKYKEMGIDFPSPLVLHGPPGCGKTFAVERLVEFIDWPCFSIDSNAVGSPFIHETSKKISEVFGKAIDSAPSVLVIDEMESFLSDRRFGHSSGLHHVEEVAEFLRRIPEAINRKVLIIAMTNMIDMIDPAILRRGRFDHVIEVGMPSRIEVASLIDSLLVKIPKSEGLELDPVIDSLTGKALSDSAFVIREAARIAAKDGKHQVDQESLFAAISSLPKEDKIHDKKIGF